MDPILSDFSSIAPQLYSLFIFPFQSSNPSLITLLKSDKLIEPMSILELILVMKLSEAPGCNHLKIDELLG